MIKYTKNKRIETEGAEYDKARKAVHFSQRKKFVNRCYVSTFKSKINC